MDVLSEVDEEEIAEGPVDLDRHPVFKLTEEETEKLLHEEELHKLIISQERSAWCRARRAAPERSQGSAPAERFVIFLGPSGVGGQLSKAPRSSCSVTKTR